MFLTWLQGPSRRWRTDVRRGSPRPCCTALAPARAADISLSRCTTGPPHTPAWRRGRPLEGPPSTRRRRPWAPGHRMRKRTACGRRSSSRSPPDQRGGGKWRWPDSGSPRRSRRGPPHRRPRRRPGCRRRQERSDAPCTRCGFARCTRPSCRSSGAHRLPGMCRISRTGRGLRRRRPAPSRPDRPALRWVRPRMTRAGAGRTRRQLGSSLEYSCVPCVDGIRRPGRG